MNAQVTVHAPPAWTINKFLARIQSDLKRTGLLSSP